MTGPEHDRRVATFRVEEIWKGDVEASILVNGSGWALEAREEAEREGRGVAASEERRFDQGVRYLVVTDRASGGVLHDNGVLRRRTKRPA